MPLFQSTAVVNGVTIKNMTNTEASDAAINAASRQAERCFIDAVSFRISGNNAYVFDVWIDDIDKLLCSVDNNGVSNRMKIDRFTLTQQYDVEIVVFSDSDYHAPIRILAADLVRFTADRRAVKCLIARDSFVYGVKQDERTCVVVHYTTLFEKTQVIWHSHFKESIETSIETYRQHMGIKFPQIEI